MLRIKIIRKDNLLLWFIMSLAVIVRYWSINFGLPHIAARPDEWVIVTEALKLPTTLLNPGSFNYPSLYKYIVFCLYVLYFLIGLITGRYSSLADFAQEYTMDPTAFYLISRLCAAFFGVFTVYVVYRLVKELWSREVALLAAFYLSVAYLHVRDSHFGTVDIPQGFFIMCAILFIARSYRDVSLKNIVIAGVFAGFASGTKYAGVLLVIPMAIAIFLHKHGDNVKGIKIIFDTRLFLFLGVLIGTFLLVVPYAIFDFSHFIKDSMFEIYHHLNAGHRIIIGRGWWYHLRFSLLYGLGWPLLFSSLLGMAILFKKDFKNALILFSFPIAYYISAGRGYTVFTRYAIPLIPFLCISAAFFVILITDILFARFAPRIKHLSVVVLVLSLALPSFWRVIQFNLLLAQRDNRLIAAEWVDSNLPGGSSVYQSGSIWGKLQIYPTSISLKKDYAGLHNNAQGLMLKTRIDYYRKKGVIGYEQWEYDVDSGNFRIPDMETKTLPQYIIIEKSPLQTYSALPEGIEKIVSLSYFLRQSFVAIDLKETANIFDQQDAFYVPYAGFRNVLRPGPNIYIYEKK